MTNDSNYSEEKFSLLADDDLEEPLENGGDFFSDFYYGKLEKDIIDEKPSLRGLKAAVFASLKPLCEPVH